MNYKQYRLAKLAVVIILAVIFSQSIVRENFFLPVIMLACGALAMLFLRRRLKEVAADERDYQIGGKAAILAIQIYAWFAVVAMFAFYSQKSVDPIFEPIGMALAFSTTFLLLLYALIYRYYDKFKFSDKGFLYTLFVLTFFIIMAIAGLRTFFTPEDTWLCDNGQWVKHGSPSAPQPRISCEEKGTPEFVGWQDIVGAVENCEVAQVMRTHAREITATLKDRRVLTAKEDNIDDVFAIVLANQAKCGTIIMATE